jgi:hypothetical protein
MKKMFSFAVTCCFLLCLASQTWAAPNAPILSYETNGLTVSVSWTEVIDAYGYELYFAPFPYTGPSTINSIDLGKQTSLSTTLPEGSAYIVAVTAYGSSGEESIFSNTQSFTLEKPAPGVPVLSYDIDGMNITVSWTNVPDATGYKLYYASALTPDTYTGLDVGNQANVSFSLWDGASFSLKISAYNAQGESAFSGIKNFTVIADLDRDGFGVSQGDCNDSNNQIKPGTTDVCGDGIDQDCSGTDEVCAVDLNDIDNDSDGFTENQGDCNDSNSSIYIEAIEVCGDGIDQDCSGADLICAGIDTSLFAETVLHYRTWDDARGNYMSENTDPNYHYISLYEDGTFSDMRYGYCASGQWSYNGQKLTLNRTSGCSSLASYSTETSNTLSISTAYEGNSSDGAFRFLDMAWDNMPQGNWTQWLDAGHLQ